MSKYLFAEVTKTEKQDDGTIKVWGYASSGAVDSDGETITPAAMKKAIPAYMEYGAVREMHKADAAGTAIEASVGEDGRTWFGAHVVDPIAVKKVQTGVYKGFSIGGRVPKGGRDPLNKTIINDIELIEVSLVDRPANPEAKITVYKNDKAEIAEDLDEIATLVDSGDITLKDLIKAAKAAKEKTPEPDQDPKPVAKAEGTETPPEPAPAKETITKGMYGVSRMASVLQDIASLACDSAYEASYEGDGSPVPAALQKWLRGGADILKAMTEEECSEMCAQLGVAVATLKAAKPELFKISTPQPSLDVNKLVEEAINKAITPLSTALATVTKENGDLKAKVDTLSKQAAPGKAVLQTINKSTDAGSAIDHHDQTPNPDGVAPPAGTLERAEWEMRKIHKAGTIVPASPWMTPHARIQG